MRTGMKEVAHIAVFRLGELDFEPCGRMLLVIAVLSPIELLKGNVDLLLVSDIPGVAAHEKYDASEFAGEPEERGLQVGQQLDQVGPQAVGLAQQAFDTASMQRFI